MSYTRTDNKASGQRTVHEHVPAKPAPKHNVYAGVRDGRPTRRGKEAWGGRSPGRSGGGSWQLKDVPESNMPHQEQKGHTDEVGDAALLRLHSRTGTAPPYPGERRQPTTTARLHSGGKPSTTKEATQSFYLPLQTSTPALRPPAAHPGQLPPSAAPAPPPPPLMPAIELFLDRTQKILKSLVHFFFDCTHLNHFLTLNKFLLIFRV